jgi:nickel superoxide dismutase
LNLRTKLADALRPRERAYAHCDIPCGIYDPHAAQLGGETVEKMMTLIADLGVTGADDKGHLASLSRYVAVKEQHAELVKHEVRIIWGDYFKPPDLAVWPEMHDKVWEIMRLASVCRVGVNVGDAQALRAALAEFAEKFAAIKAAR